MQMNDDHMWVSTKRGEWRTQRLEQVINVLNNILERVFLLMDKVDQGIPVNKR